MKILGLLGVWLWLGTLLANAGGAEKTRIIHLAFAEDGDSQALAVSACAAARAGGVDDDLSNAAPDFAVLSSPQILPHRLAPEKEAAAPAIGMRTLRRLLVAWHLGQGPPRAPHTGRLSEPDL